MIEEELTEEEFSNIIQAKGGVEEAIDYGMSFTVCPPGQLRELYREAQMYWGVFQEKLQEVERYVELVGEATY